MLYRQCSEYNVEIIFKVERQCTVPLIYSFAIALGGSDISLPTKISFPEESNSDI
jgi:hypothetical protein